MWLIKQQKQASDPRGPIDDTIQNKIKKFMLLFFMQIYCLNNHELKFFQDDIN